MHGESGQHPEGLCVELHLRPMPLGRRISRRIRDAGGSYSHCRGHSTVRFVTVPLDPDLVRELVREFGGRRTTVVLRGRHWPQAWMHVHHLQRPADPWAELVRQHEAAGRDAVRRGMMTEDDRAKLFALPAATEHPLAALPGA